ncbi:MAG: D-alanyl-D-alanine carboxypeptidase family protein, partial [Spirochaetota bacterium]|nr:D-alanyl-D-alanine carboxypeptidase family protein [Spirochaetota bacterium]
MIKKIVVVERLKLRKKPSYVSETFNHELSFGDVLIGKKIINHIDDFSYLEIDWQMQKAYVPLQYLIEENNSYSTIGERHLKQFPLNFVPKNLVQIPSIYTVNENVLYTTQSTLTQLIKLIDAAKKENIVINVINAYKGISDLAKTYAKEYEECFMQNIVDKPCQANYHLGTVLDITTTEINNRIHPLFFKTNAFKWLKSNVTKYSFQFTSSLKSFINKNNVWKPYQIQYIKEKLNDNNNVNDKIPSSFKFIQYKKTFFYYTAKNKLTNLKYLFIHDNEHTAKRVARYAVSYYGGTIFEIINANKRNLQISINDYLINYDPNRIFTTKGIYENIKWLNPECPEPIIQTAIKQINKIKNSFLKSLSLTKKDHLFSIHTNNKMTELSINYF